MESNSWYLKMIAWRESHIKQRNFILILSFVVGIFAAIAAFLEFALGGLDVPFQCFDFRLQCLLPVFLAAFKLLLRDFVLVFDGF